MSTPNVPDLAHMDGHAVDLSALRSDVSQARATLARLRTDIAEAERLLHSHPAAQLLEANEHLVVAALRAQADADTAADAAAQALQAVTRSAELDPLTQLPNRVLLRDRLAQAIAGAQRRGTRAAVLFIDLNDFKRINDQQGHAVGDRALQVVAERLAAATRAVDTVSRHGGDEFLVVMAEIAHAADAVLVADKLGAALAAPCRIGGQPVALGASIGISLYPDDGEDADTLIAHADAAMYQAKRRGIPHCLYGDGAPASVSAADALTNAHAAPAVRVGDDAVQRCSDRATVAADASRDLATAVASSHAQHMQALAVVAHELRAPLVPLRAAAALLVKADIDAPTRQRLQAVVERQLDHLGCMVGDLLDLSRATTGKLRLDCRTVDLGELVAEAVWAFRPVLRTRRQTFEVRVPAGPHRVHGDPVRLAQVLSNLLDNASKYTAPEGAIGLSVETSRQARVLTVWDNGIGISPDVLPRVFEPFVQDPQSVGPGNAGLGIGLAVVRDLVVAHGGSVCAFSDGPGTGSRFVVTLPCEPG